MKPTRPSNAVASYTLSGTATSPSSAHHRKARWSHSAAELAFASVVWAMRAGAAGSLTSKTATCVPSSPPSSVASWPTPISRPSPTGCR